MRSNRIRLLATGLGVALLAAAGDAASQPAIDPNDAASRNDTNPYEFTIKPNTPPSFTTPPTTAPQPSPNSDPGKYLGQLSANPYAPDSTGNPYGKYGSPYAPESVTNQFGPYGSPFRSNSASNPYATDTPKVYDSRGNYRGKLSANPYDPESTSNPYGRYGSPYSPESITNPYGAGSPYAPESPNNPYGKGMGIYFGGGPEQPGSSE